ncbi:MAG: hypothetical protein A3K09_07170 [Nitrospinae bacterium RIFCSPLOWO2_12_FULL_47_7]|nr:MAG: hypothetical protein A3K09_07170 [Nitrospinae bacterium RIFCSPLOWO2_12_FULL_47_7]
MIGGLEILMIAIIFAIIYGRDAIDKTFRKRADETVGESFVTDIQEYYKKDPKRTVKVIVIVTFAVIFLSGCLYWIFFKTHLLRQLGIGLR